MFRFKDKFIAGCALLTLQLFLVGCGGEEITVTRVPKEKTAPERQERTGAPDGIATAPPMAQSSGPYSADDLHWAAPVGWEVLPAAGMRLASLRSPGDGDFSLIVLPDSPDLSNVNRWLGQIGRPPVSPEGLLEIRDTLTTAVGDFHIYQLEGEGPEATSILAAIHRRDRHAIFFRLQGSRETIREQRPFFDGFLMGFHLAEDHNTGLIQMTDQPAYGTDS